MNEFQQAGYGQQAYSPFGQSWGGGPGVQPFGAIGQMGQGVPMPPPLMQHPLLAQHLMHQYPLLQPAMMNPPVAQQLVQQHPLFQQAVQQYLLQQLQQIQQQQQFQQPGIVGQQGWAGIGQYGQPMGLDPYGAWLQQQALASQIRGMPSFQPGPMGGFPGLQGIPPGQPGGQTLH